jgi:hypothetical protein
LDLESPPEVVAAGVGLVSAAEAGPVQRVVDDLRRLTNDVEQASDLGNGERDHSPTTTHHRCRIDYC